MSAERIMDMDSASQKEVLELLELKFEQYNTPQFIHEDPIIIPHQFKRKEDIEISGFLIALIAWGRRSMIIKNGNILMERMDHQPWAFIMDSSANEQNKLGDFVHRTFNGIDAVGLIRSLRDIYLSEGGLEGIFSNGVKETDENTYYAIIHARKKIIENSQFPLRTHKHVANPAKNSSAKRINMFLRWMVRKDNRGVDFGIWNKIKPAQLICPLDVHTANVSRKLGLLARKQNDWKAAVELTQSLKAFHAEDPVRYDFSLFGLGIYDRF